MRPAEAVFEAVRPRLGLAPHERWITALERAEAGLLQSRGLTLAQVALDIGSDPTLFTEVVTHLTVGETHFFRQAAHFDALTEHVTSLLRESGQRHVVIWSAGCASGEEAYSIAIALHRRFGDAIFERVTIRGTDVDESALRVAAEAHYLAWSLRGVPAWFTELYLEPVDDHTFRVASPLVRSAVAFESGTLSERAASIPGASLDAVFYRNVAIYLEPEAHLALLAAMRRALRPEGLLFLGASDPPPTSGDYTPHAEYGPGGCYIARARARGGSVFPSARPPQRPERPAPRKHAPRLPEQRASVVVPRPAPPVRESVVVPAMPRGDQLRGALERLERGELAGSIEDLRALVFRDDQADMARFWLAQALLASGREDAALRHLGELDRRLAPQPADLVLDDGVTRAGALLESVHLLLGVHR